MLRKFLDYQLSFFEEGSRLHRLRPLVSAADTFCYEVPENTRRGPHIRDAVDLKRWMVLVVIALLPCVLMAIWNSGLLSYVYGSGDYQLMDRYLAASSSFSTYFEFAFEGTRWLTILGLGLKAFLPIVLISYLVGGLWEGIFAIMRGHEISEGFLVTGILYALILPSTLPYWMCAIGVTAGVVIGKELFGGTGMNILNPALTCRVFLFFTFPGRMTGEIWVGTNPMAVSTSLKQMNEAAGRSGTDGYTQASYLAQLNVGPEIKRVQVDAIATNNVGLDVPTINVIETQFSKWQVAADQKSAVLGQLTADQMKGFVTLGVDQGGLGLSSDSYDAAYHLAGLKYGLGTATDGNFFFGNQIGSMGETSVFFCLLGALFLIITGVGAWRTMVAMGIGAYITALFFELGSQWFGPDGGAWNPAKFDLAAYKHLLLGGLMFGIVFMATDPVSSPQLNRAKWIYGFVAGAIAILIRIINPAYPEGVMLGILFANVFAPIFDYYSVRGYRRLKQHVRA
jgi:Na+-transporting NADH:ubiquinone oxidoreductase subunit B